MIRLNVLLKLATVASAVLLMAGFVSYRAGAFGWLSDSGTRSVDAEGIPSSEGNLAEDPSTDSAAQGERTIMSGSKSIKLSGGNPSVSLGEYKPKTEPPLPNPADVQPPATPEPPPPKATERERTLLPGSKSAPVANPKTKP